MHKIKGQAFQQKITCSMGVLNLSLLQNIILMKTCQLTLSQPETLPPTLPHPTYLLLTSIIQNRAENTLSCDYITAFTSPVSERPSNSTSSHFGWTPSLSPPTPERTFCELPLLIPHMPLTSLPLQSSTGVCSIPANQPALLPDPLPPRAPHRPGIE